MLGRITAGKGQHIAARLAQAAGVDLLLAGPVGPYRQPAALAMALATDPEAARNPDVRYWCDEVMPHVDGHRVRWLGSVCAAERNEILGKATASVFPLQWEEPGGTAVVESLALGTPVLGYRRGCLSELIDETSTGLLVDPGDEDGLAAGFREYRGAEPGGLPAGCRRTLRAECDGRQVPEPVRNSDRPSWKRAAERRGGRRVGVTGSRPTPRYRR